MSRAGIRVFQVRAKSLAARPFVELVRAVRRALPPDSVLIVNDRADVARIAGADGVHVGDEDLLPDAVRRVFPGIVGLSTHSLADVCKARGCDYLGFGPIFASPTKPTDRPRLGVEGVAQARAATDLPIVAIGGIRFEDIAALRNAGASGVALVSALSVPGRYRELAHRAVEAFG